MMTAAWIEAPIPHQGRMCLLDEVLDWSADRIRCSSGGHRAADHPLRAHGRLGIACGIEIGGADHGRARRDPGGGLRGQASRGASCQRARRAYVWATRLDDVRIGSASARPCASWATKGTALYEFELRSSASRLISGRATVVLDARAASRRAGSTPMSVSPKMALVTGGSGASAPPSAAASAPRDISCTCTRIARLDGGTGRGARHRRRRADEARAVAFDVTDAAATRAVLERSGRGGAHTDPGEQCGRSTTTPHFPA